LQSIARRPEEVMSRAREQQDPATKAPRPRVRPALAPALLLVLALAAQAAPDGGLGPALATTQVRASTETDASSFDGTVQAVRQTVIAAQVSGAVIALDVKSGDPIKAGQVLARLDARAAEQTAAVGAAQVQVARAAEETARSDLQRQQQLFAQNFISRAALDRIESQYKSAQAEVAAQLAGAGASRTSSGFYVVKAPYTGIVADVAVVLGDMAMPGRPLVTLYDPTALRVSINVPQTTAARLNLDRPVRVELPGLPADRQWLVGTGTQVLPTADPATHTMEVRLDLPSGLPLVRPGTFARAWLPVNAPGAEQRLYVPQQSIVRRAELAGVYVVAADGRPALRQVRLGRSLDREVEVLAGVGPGERVALDPQAAARARSAP
jgi:multidrug efflux system membrane fusion protein